MRMRQITHRQLPADIRITPQEYKPDPEVSLKHDDVYARAWECEYEKPIFDAENNNTTLPETHEILKHMAEGLETSNWRGNITGLRDAFFFPFPWKERWRLCPAALRDGATTGT